jgi:hypothetical protein
MPIATMIAAATFAIGWCLGYRTGLRTGHDREAEARSIRTRRRVRTATTEIMP